MAISESFLVNADRLNPIIKTLIDNGEVPESMTDEKLKSIGFDNPADLLVIHIFKELNILDSDGVPTELFDKLIDPETSKMAIAEGIMHGYKDLIDQHANIHKMKADELQKKFYDYFDGKKTELVLKYMANTFVKLVNYAGYDNFEEAYEQAGGAIEEEVDTSAEEHAGMSMNGSSTTHTVSEIKKEDKGESSIEEVLNVDQSKKVMESSSGADLSDEEVAETSDTVETSEETEEVSEVSSEEEESTTEDEDQEYLDALNLDQPDFSKSKSSQLSTKKPTALESSSEKVQQAFLKKADLLYKLGRYEELAPTLKAIINKFDNSDDPALVEAVENSVIRRATVLAKLKRNDELLPALDEVIDRFEASNDTKYYEQASKAMLNKANLLEAKNQTQNLLPLYNKITARLEDSTSEVIKDSVDQIYLKRMSLVLEQTDDKALALTTVEEVIQRFQDAADADEYLEEAMFKKASLLEEMGSDEEALSAYSEFLERFGDKS